MKYLLIFVAGLIGLTILSPGYAGVDFGCMEDCYRQGYGRNHCSAMCQNHPAPGMLDQPGLPRNPAFDQLQQNPPQQRQPALIADPRCVDDCRRRGYNYSVCQRQCSY